MKIRQIKINNFRGIKTLDWSLPSFGKIDET